MECLTYDTRTNTAGSKEWLAATKNLVIFAGDSFYINAGPEKSGITLRDFFGSHIAEAVSTIKNIKL